VIFLQVVALRQVWQNLRYIVYLANTLYNNIIPHAGI